MRPDCIVLDEATTMLDPEGRTEVLTTVKALNRDGITIILISHAMEDLEDAGRIIALDSGRIVLDGPTAEVFDRIEGLPGRRLDAPPMARLARWLREDGLPLPQGLYTVEQLADALTAVLSGRTHPDA
jgi:energy-coupling factor transport system ATP-binding protein